MPTRLEQENPLKIGEIYELNWNEIIPVWKLPNKPDLALSKDEIVSYLHPAERFLIVGFRFFDTEENFTKTLHLLMQESKRTGYSVQVLGSKHLYAIKILGSDKMGWIYIGKQIDKNPMWDTFRLVKE